MLNLRAAHMRPCTLVGVRDNERKWYRVAVNNTIVLYLSPGREDTSGG